LSAFCSLASTQSEGKALDDIALLGRESHIRKIKENGLKVTLLMEQNPSDSSIAFQALTS